MRYFNPLWLYLPSYPTLPAHTLSLSLSLSDLMGKMGFLPCPLPCQSNEETDSESHPNNNKLHSQASSTSCSSSNSSLCSQPSLPSVPSLTQPHQPSTTTTHHCLATLKAHSSYIFSLALARKHLFSGSSDGDVRIWTRDPSGPPHNSTSTGNIVISDTHSAVKSLAVLGDRLFTAHQDHKIRVWKTETETETETGPPNQKLKCLSTLPTLNDRVSTLFSAKNYVKIRRHVRRTWVHHVDAVSALAVSGDGSLLYSASWDRTMKVWRSSDFKCLESIWNAHDDAINALAVSEDGLVYTGSADRRIKVWRKEEGGKKHCLVSTLEKHGSSINALALSNDGSVLYSGACDRSIIVWEKSGGGGEHMVVAGALRGHTKAILCLGVVGDLVCSGSADKTVRMWRRGQNGKGYNCLGVLEGHRGPVKCLTGCVLVDSRGSSCNGISDSESGNSYMVYSGSLDCDIKVWNIWVPLS